MCGTSERRLEMGNIATDVLAAAIREVLFVFRLIVVEVLRDCLADRPSRYKPKHMAERGKR